MIRFLKKYTGGCAYFPISSFSEAQRERMLKKTGFKRVSFYAAIPSYRELEAIIPVDTEKEIKNYYRNYGLNGLRGIKKLIPQLILKLGVMRYFVPSFLILAEK